jgi:hypothetical protein
MNAELERHLQSIRATQPSIDKLEARLKTKKAYLQEHLRAAQELIAAGEKSDDRFLDMVIRGHGTLDEELALRYRKLEGSLQGRRGEFVTVEFIADVPYKFSQDCVESRRHILFRIGVLTEESLIFAALNPIGLFKECTVPVAKYVEGDTDQLLLWSGGSIRQSKQENLFFGASLYDDGPPSLRQWIANPEICKIIVGNDAVRAWLDERHAGKFFKSAADALGMLILEPTE